MTQLATIKQAGDYLCVAHHKEFALMFGGDDRKATSFLAVALANIQREPKLLQCNRESIRDSLLEAAQIDLCPGGALGQAFLIPYGRECQFQVGYKGLAEIVQREGAVKKVWANVVYQDEIDEGKFVVRSGSEHSLYHDRDPFREDPASWEELLNAGLCGAYACAELHNGAVNFETVGMDPLRRAKAMSSSPAWKKWATEMVKKFPLKRLCKRLPKTLHIEQWAAIDERHGKRDAIPLRDPQKVSNAVQLADDALGDTTVVLPASNQITRDAINAQIESTWHSLQSEERRRLDMDRELGDYLDEDRTSDAEAHHFLDTMMALLT
ncbi:MAG: recombinase RecT [Gemmatimonadetes bacterium]|nr:recombinase RecT [Gemmatimonadota bacterium]